MRKLLGLVLVAASLLISGAAQSAPVNIRFATTATAGTFDVFLETGSEPTAINVAAVAFLVTGATGFTFNPVLTASGGVISIPDSVNRAEGAVWHVVANTPNFGQTMFAFPLATPVLFGTFVIPGETTAGGAAGRAIPGDNDGGTIQDLDFNAYEARFVPEPTVAVLLGLGLAGLAFVRRAA
jgi:hypothetical protein